MGDVHRGSDIRGTVQEDALILFDAIIIQWIPWKKQQLRRRMKKNLKAWAKQKRKEKKNGSETGIQND